ncbi:hypothetical protein JCM19314_2391 [Nonlabens ulvanivorans]|uniref:Uncharacterized protein n=1 Tax=Nonlabens ulvanivorans TaxID=906888 RepID=A0A090Q5S1_NONUL|nr:hypothetical protein JCM19314_2391 [Nonlabens ulvanivorans]
MTKRNIPRVIMVTGNVSITRIGLTIKFRSDNEMATKIALRYPSVLTPGNSFESNTTNSAVINSLIINFIMYDLGGKNKKIRLSKTETDFNKVLN